MAISKGPGADVSLTLRTYTWEKDLRDDNVRSIRRRFKAFAARFGSAGVYLDEEDEKATWFGGLASGRNGSAKRRVGERERNLAASGQETPNAERAIRIDIGER